jgi:hypothetical protein
LIGQIRIAFESNNWPEAKKTSALAAHLENKAFYEYRNLDSSVQTDYASLVQVLKNKFCSSDHKRFAHQRFEHCKQKQSQSVYEYANDDWDELLPVALYAYRTSVHQSTGDTPFYLMFGRDSPNLGDVPDAVDLGKTATVHWPTPARLTKAVTLARRKALSSIREAQEAQKTAYDEKTKVHNCLLPRGRRVPA